METNNNKQGNQDQTNLPNKKLTEQQKEELQECISKKKKAVKDKKIIHK